MPNNEVRNPITDAAVQLRRLTLDREQVLDRLWEIANMSPEMTRGSITGQVKAVSMIVAMQNFIPDPRAVARHAVPEKQSHPAPAAKPQIHASAHPPRPSLREDPPWGGPSSYVPVPFIPDLKIPSSVANNPFVHPR